MIPAKLLIVENDHDQRSLMEQVLRSQGFDVESVESAEIGLEKLATQPFDLIISDWLLAGLNGTEFLQRVRSRFEDIGFIMVTGHGTIARAVEAIQRGADDYLSKPFEATALTLSVQRVIKARQLERECRYMREALQERDRLVDLIGRSPAMQRVFVRVERLADTDATVLITGESGTGKELAARALHALSSRKEGPFCAINCAAIPKDLVESEFFGAEKGAFTGASNSRRGKFDFASEGTLFLDELVELPLAIQPKLLRVLQERKFTPIGSTQERSTQARVIAATNGDLAEAVASQKFREDLYYRLNVVPIRMPALRERPEDIPALVHYFVGTFARRHQRGSPEVPTNVLRKLLDYSWPGNVRELANVIERLVLLSEQNQLSEAELDESLQSSNKPLPDQHVFRLPPSGINWKKHERDCLRQAMEISMGNRSHAARLLGLSYKTFLYRLEKSTQDSDDP